MIRSHEMYRRFIDRGAMTAPTPSRRPGSHPRSHRGALEGAAGRTALHHRRHGLLRPVAARKPDPTQTRALDLRTSAVVLTRDAAAFRRDAPSLADEPGHRVPRGRSRALQFSRRRVFARPAHGHDFVAGDLQQRSAAGEVREHRPWNSADARVRGAVPRAASSFSRALAPSTEPAGGFPHISEDFPAARSRRSRPPRSATASAPPSS